MSDMHNCNKDGCVSNTHYTQMSTIHTSHLSVGDCKICTISTLVVQLLIRGYVTRTHTEYNYKPLLDAIITLIQ